MSTPRRIKSMPNLIGLTIYTEAFGPVKVLEATWPEAAQDYVVVVDQQGSLFASFGNELVHIEDLEHLQPNSQG